MMAGSAFSAKNTCCARPEFMALRSCFAPTTTFPFGKSGKLPHWGILLSFLVSIQKLIIRKISEMSTEIISFFAKIHLFYALCFYKPGLTCVTQADKLKEEHKRRQDHVISSHFMGH